MDRNDLISRSALKEEVNKKNVVGRFNTLLLIDNAPTVDFEKLGETLNCQIRATYGSCDDCELSCPRNELIKLLNSTRPQGEWVPVSERWPSFSGLYLVSIDDLVTVAHFTGACFINRKGLMIDVSAWQELPEPYKKDGADMRQDNEPDKQITIEEYMQSLKGEN